MLHLMWSVRVPLTEAVQNQQASADGDRTIGDIERRKVPAVPMDQQKIHDVPQRHAIAKVAERAAQDQRESRAVPAVTTTLEQPHDEHAGCYGDSAEQVALPAGGFTQKAECSPGIERQYYAEERGNHAFLAGTKHRQDGELGKLVSRHDRQAQDEP